MCIADIRHRRLPNRLVAWAVCTPLGLLAASRIALLPTAQVGVALRDLAFLVGGAAAMLALFVLLWTARPAALGGGDVKAAPLAGGVLAFFTGAWGTFSGLVIACAFAALWGALARRGTGRERGIPFAACLFAATWLVLLGAPSAARLFTA